MPCIFLLVFADNNTNLCFITILFTTICPAGGQLGAYSQTLSLEITFYVHFSQHTLYTKLNFLVLIIHEHVCSPQKLKTNSRAHVRTYPQPPPPPNCGKCPSCSRARLDNPGPTDITRGKPVWRYTIPSSTIVLPENRAPDKPTGHLKGLEQPDPNLIY